MQNLYSLYIDGGSTTTKVYVMDQERNIIQKNIFDGLNLQTRFDESLNTIVLIKKMFLEKKLFFIDIFLGAPGIEQCENTKLIENELKDLSKESKIFFLTDIEIQEKMFCSGDNYIVISFGSGTIMHTNENGSRKRYFGWGHMLYDPCSAYSFTLFWIKKAILDFENEIKNSPFINEVLTFFDFKSIEEIKKLYSNLNNFKTIFQEFAVKILVEKQKDNESSINYVLEEMVLDFFQYFDKLKINKKINEIFLLGGMVKNQTLKDLLVNEFTKRNYVVL